MSCSAKTCVTGYTMDSTGNCVPTPSQWSSNTSIGGLTFMSYQNSSPSDCQQKCLSNSDCDVAMLDPSNKCILSSKAKQSDPSSWCVRNWDTGYQVFQKPSGAVPSICSN
jgi:hypothetical protein